MVRIGLLLTVIVATIGILGGVPGQSVREAIAPAPPPAAGPAMPVNAAPGLFPLSELQRYHYARHVAVAAASGAHPDLSLQQASREQRFRASVLARTEPVVLHQFQAWRVHLADADGRPLAGAVVDVDGVMPEHDATLPGPPKVRAEEAPGDYLIENLRFTRPGWWRITLHVAHAGRHDRVVFDAVIE